MTLAIVTGAPGWLGSRLVQTLLAEPGSSQRPVRCLVQADADASALERLSPHVQIIRGDLTRPETLRPLFEGADGATVFHVAGVIHPGLTTRAFFRVNVRGTRHLLDAASAAQARRLIYLSSNSPFGTNPSREHTFDEGSAYHPYMKYGKSKMLAEKLVQGAHQAGDIETVIVRSPWFYGPGQPPRQTLFFRMIRDGKVPVVGDGGNRRSMAYVDNICQGLLLAERSPRAAGEAYWIADRRPYTMNEIIAAVEAVLEREFKVRCRHGRVNIPGFVGEVATAIDASMQAVGLYHQKLHVLGEMNKTIACSISKAEQELGYNPSVDLEEGMKRSIQWLVEQGETF
jgi:nucleoside-diphosphate-sugar epimerase